MSECRFGWGSAAANINGALLLALGGRRATAGTYQEPYLFVFGSIDKIIHQEVFQVGPGPGPVPGSVGTDSKVNVRVEIETRK